MANEKLDQEIAVRLSSSNIETLRFLSDSWNMNISEVIRALIPKLHHLNSINQTDNDRGPLKILEDFDRARLSNILKELISENKAKTLAMEIKAQLLDCTDKRNNLTGTTEKRLLRWAHPARFDDRTKYATPRALEICRILYGFLPPRKK